MNLPKIKLHHISSVTFVGKMVHVQPELWHHEVLLCKLNQVQHDLAVKTSQPRRHASDAVTAQTRFTERLRKWVILFF